MWRLLSYFLFQLQDPRPSLVDCGGGRVMLSKSICGSENNEGGRAQFVAYFGALFLRLQLAPPAVPFYCAMFRKAALFQQNAP